VTLTHRDLCKLAISFLKRPPARGGHGCSIAIDECRTGISGEIVDAIGFRNVGNLSDGSVLIECKVSYSDFKADRLKPHRSSGGVGNWRYFLAPEGVIPIAELPVRWGLVEITSRGHFKTVAGVYTKGEPNEQEQRLQSMRFDSDQAREIFLLSKLFTHVGDIDKLNDIGKDRNRLAFRVNKLVEEARQMERSRRTLMLELEQAQEQIARYRQLHGDLSPVTPIARLA
jgi:hypothetical protein